MAELLINALYSDADLVSYWRFEDNLNDTMGTNNLTASGSVTYSSTGGKFTKYGIFGSGIYGYKDSATNVDFATGGYTLCAWVYRTSGMGTGDTAIIAKQVSGYGGYMMWYNNHKIIFYINGGIRASGTTTIPVDTWTHVACVYSGTTAKVYINGVEDASGSYSTAPNGSTGRFWIGRYYDAWYFTGRIDDAAVFKRVLTPTELLSLVSAGSPSSSPSLSPSITPSASESRSPSLSPSPSSSISPSPSLSPSPSSSPSASPSRSPSRSLSLSPSRSPSITPSSSPSASPSITPSSSPSRSPSPTAASPGPVQLINSPLYSDADLVSYWRMEGNVNDTMGTNNLTNSGMTFASTNSLFTQYGLTSHTGPKYAYKDSATTLDFAGSFTLMAWIYRDTTQGATDSAIIAKQVAGFGGYMMWYNANTIRFYINTGTRATGATTIPANTWTHVACVYNGTTAKVYVNGVEDGTGNYSTAPNSAGGRFWIGRYYDTWHFNGQVDDVAIFKRALTPTELLSLVDSGAAPSVSPSLSPSVSVSSSGSLSPSLSESASASLSPSASVGFSESASPSSSVSPSSSDSSSASLSPSASDSLSASPSPSLSESPSPSLSPSASVSLSPSVSESASPSASMSPSSAGPGNRYWVGGTGNWNDDTNHWSLTSGGPPNTGNLPTVDDDVIFDTNSGLSGATITIPFEYVVAHNITSTTGVSYTINFASHYIIFYGDLTLESGVICQAV